MSSLTGFPVSDFLLIALSEFLGVSLFRDWQGSVVLRQAARLFGGQSKCYPMDKIQTPKKSHSSIFLYDTQSIGSRF